MSKSEKANVAAFPSQPQYREGEEGRTFDLDEVLEQYFSQMTVNPGVQVMGKKIFVDPFKRKVVVMTKFRQEVPSAPAEIPEPEGE